MDRGIDRRKYALTLCLVVFTPAARLSAQAPQPAAVPAGIPGHYWRADHLLGTGSAPPDLSSVLATAQACFDDLQSGAIVPAVQPPVTLEILKNRLFIAVDTLSRVYVREGLRPQRTVDVASYEMAAAAFEQAAAPLRRQFQEKLLTNPGDPSLRAADRLTAAARALRMSLPILVELNAFVTARSNAARRTERPPTSKQPPPLPVADEPVRQPANRAAELPGARREAPVAGPEMLVLRGGAGVQGVGLPDDPRLNPGTRGTVDLWVSAGWTEPPQENVTVVRHGSSNQTIYSIYITPRRDGVGFWVGGDKFTVWEADLSDGAPHHLAFVTSGDTTEAFIDGRSAGRRQMAYGQGPPTGLPLAIGRFPFVGSIGSLRMWNTTLGPDEVREISRSQTAALLGSSYRMKLAGYLEIGSSGATAAFRILEPGYEASGVWMPEAERLGRRSRGPTDFLFVPANLLVTKILSWTDPIFGGQSRPGNGLVVRVPTPAGVALLALEQKGPNEFASADTVHSIKLLGHDRLQYGGQLFRRADRREAQETKIGAGIDQDRIPVGLEFTERGYHIEKLNPWDFRESGANGKIFAHLDPKSSDYTRAGRMHIPRGLHWEQDSSGGGRIEAKTIASQSEYHSQYVSEIGFSLDFEGGVPGFSTGCAFAGNRSFREALQNMQTHRTTHRFASIWCKLYSLVLDHANARLSEEFETAVNELKRNRDYAGFIARFGTHYPHAVTFGGRMLHDTAVSERTYTAMREVGEEVWGKVDASTSVEGFAKFKASLQAKYGRTLGGSSGGSEQIETEKWEQYGGSGGLGQFRCEDGKERPVNLDLRLLHELLAPPYFYDPEIVGTVRSGLEAELQRVLAAAAAANKDLLQTMPVIDFDHIERKLSAPRKYEVRMLSAAIETKAGDRRNFDAFKPQVELVARDMNGSPVWTHAAGVLPGVATKQYTYTDQDRIPFTGARSWQTVGISGDIAALSWRDATSRTTEVLNRLEPDPESAPVNIGSLEPGQQASGAATFRRRRDLTQADRDWPILIQIRYEVRRIE